MICPPLPPSNGLSDPVKVPLYFLLNLCQEAKLLWSWLWWLRFWACLHLYSIFPTKYSFSAELELSQWVYCWHYPPTSHPLPKYLCMHLVQKVIELKDRFVCFLEGEEGGGRWEVPGWYTVCNFSFEGKLIPLHSESVISSWEQRVTSYRNNGY